jgi:NAD(P)-dependent dehydrogenase (short-subunit alcohol dehydrogenase family)
MLFATFSAVVMMIVVARPSDQDSGMASDVDAARSTRQPFPPFMFYPKDTAVGDVEEVDDETLFQRLAGRHALVVGGTDGIGRGTAIAMAQAGANVAVAGHSQAKAQYMLGNMTVVAPTRAQHFSSYVFDLLTVQGCLEFVKAVRASRVHFDFLVFTVGVWPDREAPKNSDGIDKVIALDVVARYLVTKELLPILNPGARIMSILGSTAKIPPAPPVATMKAIALGTKTDYSLDQMLATAGVMADTWLQTMPQLHTEASVSYIGTFPGIVATDLIENSKTLPAYMRAMPADGARAFAMDPLESGTIHANIISAPNAARQAVCFFNVNREGRKTNPLAYDATFAQWVISFLEDVVSTHQFPSLPLLV